jgi:spore coat protein U-like protein
MRRARLLALAAFAAALAALPGAARAQSCSVSAAGVAFGGYNPQSATADDGTGTVSVACSTSVTSVIVALTAGNSGSYTTREMESGSNVLDYNLYTTTTRTTVWGIGSGGAPYVTLSSGTVSGGQRHFSQTVYGRIPAAQNVRAGSYSDTITMIVVF